MIEITKQSLDSRVFYFHEFIYFTNTLPFDHSQVDTLVGYFLDLLILFDEILIPAEHLNISSNAKEAKFKEKFIDHKVIKELIYRGKIVTTIWSQCSTPQEQYEASDRYLSEIGATDHSYSKNIRKNLAGIQVYKRNPTHQSNQAKGYAKANSLSSGENSNYISDMLRYEDGDIVISFSHEKLILGSASHLSSDAEFIRSSKRSYIQAMPDGNGRVYRSLISGIETTTHGGSLIFTPVEVFPGDIHPVIFTPEVLSEILAKLSFMRPKAKGYRNRDWLDWFLTFSSSLRIKEFRVKAFQALEYLSSLRLDSMAAVNQSLKCIHVVRYWNVAKLMWSVLDWRALLISASTPAHEYILKQMTDRYFYFPSFVIEEYNSNALKYSK